MEQIYARFPTPTFAPRDCFSISARDGLPLQPIPRKLPHVDFGPIEAKASIYAPLIDGVSIQRQLVYLGPVSLSFLGLEEVASNEIACLRVASPSLPSTVELYYLDRSASTVADIREKELPIRIEERPTDLFATFSISAPSTEAQCEARKSCYTDTIIEPIAVKTMPQHSVLAHLSDSNVLCGDTEGVLLREQYLIGSCDCILVPVIPASFEAAIRDLPNHSLELGLADNPNAHSENILEPVPLRSTQNSVASLIASSTCDTGQAIHVRELSLLNLREPLVGDNVLKALIPQAARQPLPTRAALGVFPTPYSISVNAQAQAFLESDLAFGELQIMPKPVQPLVTETLDGLLPTIESNPSAPAVPLQIIETRLYPVWSPANLQRLHLLDESLLREEKERCQLFSVPFLSSFEPSGIKGSRVESPLRLKCLVGSTTNHRSSSSPAISKPSQAASSTITSDKHLVTAVTTPAINPSISTGSGIDSFLMAMGKTKLNDKGVVEWPPQQRALPLPSVLTPLHQLELVNQIRAVNSLVVMPQSLHPHFLASLWCYNLMRITSRKLLIIFKSDRHMDESISLVLRSFKQAPMYSTVTSDNVFSPDHHAASMIFASYQSLEGLRVNPPWVSRLGAVFFLHDGECTLEYSSCEKVLAFVHSANARIVAVTSYPSRSASELTALIRAIKPVQLVSCASTDASSIAAEVHVIRVALEPWMIPVSDAFLHIGQASFSALFDLRFFTKDCYPNPVCFETLSLAEIQYFLTEVNKQYLSLNSQGASPESLSPLVECASSLIWLQFAHAGLYHLLYQGLSSARAFVAESVAVNQPILGEIGDRLLSVLEQAQGEVEAGIHSEHPKLDLFSRIMKETYTKRQQTNKRTLVVVGTKERALQLHGVISRQPNITSTLCVALPRGGALSHLRHLLETHNCVLVTNDILAETDPDLSELHPNMEVLEYDHDISPLLPHIAATIDLAITGHTMLRVDANNYLHSESVADDWISEVRKLFTSGSVIPLQSVLKDGAWSDDVPFPPTPERAAPHLPLPDYKRVPSPACLVEQAGDEQDSLEVTAEEQALLQDSPPQPEHCSPTKRPAAQISPPEQETLVIGNEDFLQHHDLVAALHSRSLRVIARKMTRNGPDLILDPSTCVLCSAAPLSDVLSRALEMRVKQLTPFFETICILFRCKPEQHERARAFMNRFDRIANTALATDASKAAAILHDLCVELAFQNSKLWEDRSYVTPNPTADEISLIAAAQLNPLAAQLVLYASGCSANTILRKSPAELQSLGTIVPEKAMELLLRAVSRKPPSPPRVATSNIILKRPAPTYTPPPAAVDDSPQLTAKKKKVPHTFPLVLGSRADDSPPQASKYLASSRVNSVVTPQPSEARAALEARGVRKSPPTAKLEKGPALTQDEAVRRIQSFRMNEVPATPIKRAKIVEPPRRSTIASTPSKFGYLREKIPTATEKLPPASAPTIGRSWMEGAVRSSQSRAPRLGAERVSGSSQMRLTIIPPHSIYAPPYRSATSAKSPEE